MKEIFITQHDLARLTDLILNSRSFSDGFANSHLRNLARELNLAKIVDSRNIPDDVVTMNSKVRLLELPSEQTFIYTLVFPSDENGDPGKLSILTPLGTALIGYRSGDSFDVLQESATRTYGIEDILYQPERAGDFHL
jgi:regulator of nucleoside diphosphate kinase